MKQVGSQISSYLSIKGAMSEATYRAFLNWNLAASAEENFQEILATNSIGASSSGWLKEFTKVLKRRYDLATIDRPLIELVQQGWSLDDWRPVLLWHICRTDELLRTFLTDWLFDKFQNQIVVISTEPVCEYLRSLVKKRLGPESSWTDNTYRRVASGLLKIATEFHLMRGRVIKEFSAYRLPDRSFVYLLHVLMDREQNTRKVVEAKDWRMFLVKPGQVEEELLRLHQYGQLRFERAGSLLELTLPSANTSEFIRSTAS